MQNHGVRAGQTARLRAAIVISLAILCSGLIGHAPQAQAQAQTDLVWVQIEAHPDLVTAQSRLRVYESRSATMGVAGFMMRTGLYALALGPYPREVAQERLRDLRASGQIPSDSYMQTPQNYTRQFWPIAAQATAPQVIAIEPLPEIAPQDAPEKPSQTPVEPKAAPVTTPQTDAPPRETLAQARAGEADLDPAARDDLQRALQWFGFYDGAIDGVFGAGTRAAMAAWQRRNDWPETGVLTTAERSDLIAQWQADLGELGLERITDTRAGIAALLPMGYVEFAAYAPPFAVFAPTDARGVEVVLISAEGDQARLQSLFEIVTNADIMPEGGLRDMLRGRFDIAASDAARFTTGFARLEGGAIKGLIIRGPAAEYTPIARLMPQIEENFLALEGVLERDTAPSGTSPALNTSETEPSPLAQRSGVFVTDTGHVLTDASLPQTCSSLRLNDAIAAREIYRDSALGIVVIAPDTPLTPPDLAEFTAASRMGSAQYIAGFAYEGRLSAATLRPLEDAGPAYPTPSQTELGGPVLDATGGLLGLYRGGAVTPAADITTTLAAAGLPALPRVVREEPLRGESLARLAQAITAKVTCLSR